MCLRYEDDKGARLEIRTDTEDILNDIKVLIDRKFKIGSDDTGIITNFRGTIKIDLVNEVLMILLEPS
ncbi:MAG: hypothetical protein AB1299_03555 [Thermoproteota archaeon]